MVETSAFYMFTKKVVKDCSNAENIHIHMELKLDLKGWKEFVSCTCGQVSLVTTYVLLQRRKEKFWFP